MLITDYEWGYFLHSLHEQYSQTMTNHTLVISTAINIDTETPM